MKVLWQKISETGIYSNLAEDEIRRVRLLNRMNGIMISMIILSLLPDVFKKDVDYSFGLVLFQAIGTIVPLSIFLFVFFLTKKRKYFAAKTLWFGFMFLLATIPTYLTMNTGARIETFMLMVIPLLALLLYKQRRVAFGTLIITLLTYYLIVWLSPEPIIIFPETEKYVVLGFTAVTVILLTDQLKLVNKKYVNKLDEQKSAIERQKNELYTKNKEITDSIKYAKRIQEAILPSITAMQHALKNCFVLYQPKDVVAGDFYWLETHNDVIYFAAADCTGHGVPGAMISVICSNALSKALLEENNTETGSLLDRTREIVVKRLTKSKEGITNRDTEIKDGMDISLCAINFKNMTLQWSGANNPLWLTRTNEKGMLQLHEVKHDKQPVGAYYNIQPFTTHNLKLQKDDTIYIFTDGYQDQFGGKKEKKYMAKRLKQKLIDIGKEKMDKQKEMLEDEFEQWRGQNDQIDDICIIGVHIG